MVLEGSTSDDAFVNDPAPAPDSGDAYGTTTRYSDSGDPNVLTIGPNVRIDLRNLPRPFLLSGFPNRFGDAVSEICNQSANVLHRPVTQEEADALSFHLAKGFRYATLGGPVGAALAAIQTVAGRNNFKIFRWQPFKEGSKLKPDVFGPLRGPQARIMWHVSRFMALSAVYTILGSMFFQAYGVSTSAVGRTLDPRLKQLTTELQKLQKEKRGVPQSYNSPGQQPSETFEQARQRRGIQQSTHQDSRSSQTSVTRSKSRPVDDASPTGGSFEQDYMDMGAAEPSQTGSRWDQVQASANQQQQHAGSQQTAGSGSAWDRLRRGAKPDSQPSRQSQSSSGSSSPSSADPFSLGGSDQDRERAKVDAQRDFDRRLQQERDGKDFNNTDGPNRRWS